MVTIVRALLDHPSPPVVRLQRATMGALLALALGLIRLGRHLSR